MSACTVIQMVVASLSVEIQGAIVGGVIGAVAVLIGILGDSWASRIRGHRAAVEAAASELVILLPHVIGPISSMWPDDEEVETSYGSDWSKHRDEVTSLLFQIIQNARWPMRQRAEVLRAAHETSARLAAYTLLWYTHRSRITAEETFDLYKGAPGAVLSQARNLDDRVDHFDREARRRRRLPSKP